MRLVFKLKKLVYLAPIIFVFVVLFQNCSQQNYSLQLKGLSKSSLSNSNYGNPPEIGELTNMPTPSPMATPDPMIGGLGNWNPNSKIKAKLVYATEPTEASGKNLPYYFVYTPDDTYIGLNSQNVSAPLQMPMGDLHIGWRTFSNGFTLSDGTKLTYPNTSITMKEYFALDVETQIALTPDQPEGFYQLATISDDGTHMEYFDSDSQQWTAIIANDGIRPPKMRCTTKTFYLAPNSIPLMTRLQYFQGPAQEIALDLVWRRLPDSCAGDPTLPNCSSSYCDKVGGGYFYQGIDSANFKQDFLNVWKPLTIENFQ